MTTNYPSEDTIQQLIAADVAKASALSALPIPLVDTIGVMFIQMHLIEKLADQYNVKIDNRQSILIASIISAVATKLLTMAMLELTHNTQFDKFLGEALVKASFISLSTTAIGELYYVHFKAGGQIDDLNLDTVLDYVNIQLASDRLSITNIGNKLLANVV